MVMNEVESCNLLLYSSVLFLKCNEKLALYFLRKRLILTLASTNIPTKTFKMV